MSIRSHLVIIGGGERTHDGAAILRHIVRLAGGSRARFCVCTAASEVPHEAGAPYDEAFRRLGAAGVELLHLSERHEAAELAALAALERATVLFFTGGDQLRLTGLLGGTPLERLLRRRFRAGRLVVAGTSAGASVVSTTMIVGGDAEEAPKMNTIRMAPGFGLLPGVVVDQHFAERGRIGRLLSALAQNPRALGLGLDEDTAVEVDAAGRFHVLGSQTATFLDASRADFTNASESRPDQPLALGDIRLHVLPAGYGFEPAARCPVRPGEAHILRKKGSLRWRSSK